MAIRNKLLLSLAALAFASSPFIASAQSPRSEEGGAPDLDSLVLPAAAAAAAATAIIIATNSSSR